MGIAYPFIAEFQLWLNRRQKCKLEPISDCETIASGYACTGKDPAFEVRPERCDFLRGWYMLEIMAKSSVPVLPTKLYADYGQGFKEAESFFLSVKTGQLTKRLCYFPNSVRALRFDPADFPLEIKIDHFVLAKVTQSFSRKIMARKLVRAKKYESEELATAISYPEYWYEYNALFSQDLLNDYDVKLLEEKSYYTAYNVEKKLRLLVSKPKISIVMPVFDPPIQYLKECLDSVVMQSYPHWQLCIADDKSSDPKVAQLLENYTAKDQRIRWIQRAKNGHICVASNTALALAEGKYVTFLDHDDCLFPHALLEVVSSIQENPEADIFYTDEDFIDDKGRRFAPHYKSDWNPALLLSHNYVTHLTIYRRELLMRVGGFREKAGVEGSQDYDLLLRTSAETTDKNIIHIPKVLYHWRAHENSTALDSEKKSYTSIAGQKALQNYLDTSAISGNAQLTKDDNLYRIDYTIEKDPLVSLLIPTRDMLDVLAPCVSSILNKSTYQNIEILILDNQSKERETLSWFLEIQKNDTRVKILKFDKPFNYSEINNFGASHARGEIIGLINNDIEIITPQWIEELVSLAQQPKYGCVGALLYYPDDTVQHGGVILGLGGYAAHSHRGLPRGSQGYFNRLKVRQNLSAVTGACLFVRKEIYEMVGGLDEEFAVAYNDVDFCLKVLESGYLNIFTPFAELYHHESKSRGLEDSNEKVTRFNSEKEKLLEKWGNYILNDPYYNINLTRSKEDFSIRINNN
ncbi:glycosyltransferase [Microbulbifer sp. DLAB2-AF]|uniref:glycosyltransferase family 2 protein n=1 Tax=Microbulbifer sp. DLAB2-AF TaxID=3243395 RepID=UPI004039352B